MQIAEAFLALTAASRWEVVDEQRLDRAVHHAQGLAFDGEHYWVSSVDELGRRALVYVVDQNGSVLDVVEVGDPNAFHAGGIDLSGGTLWLACAPYEDAGPTLVQRLDTDTCSIETVFTVDRHLGAICATDVGLFGVGWGSRTMWCWDVEGNELSQRANPSHLLDWQDVQAVGHGLVVCGGRIRFRSQPGGVERWIGGLALVSTPGLEIVHEVPFPGYSTSGLPALAEGFVLREVEASLELTVLPDGELGPLTTWRLVS